VDSKVIELLDRHEVPRLDVYLPRVPGSGTTLRGVNVVERPRASVKFDVSAEPPRPIIGNELRREALDTIRKLFAAFQTPGEDVNTTTAFQLVSRFERVLGLLVPAVTRDISGLISIQDRASYADYPFNHSLSVAVLSIAAGEVIGFDVWQQFKLARCAILHDVGKPYVPPKIANKLGKLSNEEFNIIKEHSVNGANNLKNKGFGDSELWNGVMFHHEKIDGSGYPKGLKGEDIPIFSRIIAVADMYDAATSYRPYRDAMLPADAFDLISSEIGKSFDYDIVKAFTKKLVLYPSGLVVELSDGRTGYVVDNETVQRPVVELHEGGEILDLSHSDNRNLVIVGVSRGRTGPDSADK
jgi:putative nucleotidyltransferase with HDIG domain